MKKFLVILVVMSMLLLSFGCTSYSTDSTEGTDSGDGDVTKVALILVGPISDGGWNAMAYRGLVRIQEEFENIEINYAESVAKSDYEDMFRLYAEQDFDLVIGHGFEFADVSAVVAADYPDTMFAVINGYNTADNLASVTIDDEQVGFIAGALAGMLTETDKIAGVGGLLIPPIELVVKGYVAGAEYVNPDVEVLSTFTGSFEDVNKAKEVTRSMIDNGADVVMGDADQSSLGIIEASEEGGVLYIGTNLDMKDAAPDTVVNTAIVDGGRMFTFMYEHYLADTLGGSAYLIGINEDAVYLGDWGTFEDKIPAAVKDELQTIIDGLTDGSIDYMTMVEEVELNL